MPKYDVEKNAYYGSFYSQVATERELLSFCSEVREAGGGNPLEALLPGTPNHPSTCLIARNLNFTCSVRPIVDPVTRVSLTNHHKESIWGMLIDDADTIAKIAVALDLKITPSFDHDTSRVRLALVLPDAIGNAAAAFDRGTAFESYALGY